MEHCQAILVRKSRWSESSLLITWVTDAFGTLKTSARGALRAGSPFAGKVDLFHRAEITFTLSKASSLHSLREISLIKPFDAPRATYQTVAMA
ncbi:MAG: recombination protein O N-terminal domain-containing protein, partial [Terrimicrobiaceae bacterium]